jgi:hypothetical protein
MVSLTAAVTIAALFSFNLHAFAQATTCTGEDCGIAIGGEDKSGQLSAFANLAKTAQVFVMRYAAPVIGGIIVFYGIFKIAFREAVVGTIALIGGGALLFLPKIIQQIVKFAG